MSNSVDFKLIIPFEKSEHEKEDGWYIRGIAAGIDVDQQKDALTPKAIQLLADQINNEPIPLRNQHRVDDITEDIGLVYKAMVTPDFKLAIEARLDEDNPSAQYLWKKLSKNKKYGLSIRGSSVGYYNDIDPAVGGHIRRHPYVLAREISVTTRPVADQTFGTVLQKAIDGDSLPSPSGEIMDTNETIIVDAPAVAAESSAPENDTPKASPSDELVKSLMANDDFVNLIKTTVSEAVATQQPQPAVEEDATSVDDNTEISKSEAESSDIAELVKSAVAEASAEFSAKLEALAGRIPEVPLPGVLIKSESARDEEIIEGLRSDPRQALRVGLAARHNELDKI